GIVDGQRQVVLEAGRLQVHPELDVDLEALGLDLLARLHAVAGLEGQLGEDDAIGRGRVDHLDVPGHVPRTIASAIRAARTFASTSWTRTTSTPAAIARAVVASVAASRWSAGRSRTFPRVDFREVPSTTGRPSVRSIGSSRRSSRLCSGVFPNPKPGSTRRDSQAHPAARARSRARARSPRISGRS